MREKPSAELQASYKEWRRRNKALGIEYDYWRILVDTAAHQSLTEFWKSYLALLGRERATDYLIYLLDFGYHQLDAARKKKKVRNQCRR